MDLLEALLADMRSKTHASSAQEASDVLGYFDRVTGGAFLVNFNILKQSPRPSKIRNHYALLTGCPSARLVITQKPDYAGRKTRIHRVLHGAIISWPDWRLISIMPQAMDMKPNTEWIKRHASEYTVYPARDATVATLYYDCDQWRVSTARGIDASGYTWLGDTTYMEAITELCAAYPDFNMARLVKGHCYSVSFHHPAFHPLSAEPPGIELVQIVDAANPSVILTEDIGLPVAQPVDITVDAAIAKCDAALSDYVADNANRCFGYVFRRKTATAAPAKKPAQQRGQKGKTGPRPSAAWNDSGSDPQECDYLVESRLLLFIRKTIYDLPRGPDSIRLETPRDRIEYFCLRAALGANQDVKKLFMRIFPQYTDNFSRYTDLFATLRDMLIVAIGCNGGDVSAGRPAADTPQGHLAAYLYDGIQQHMLNINSAQTASIIDDYIQSQDHINVYHAYWRNTGAAAAAAAAAH